MEQQEECGTRRTQPVRRFPNDYKSEGQSPRELFENLIFLLPHKGSFIVMVI